MEPSIFRCGGGFCSPRSLLFRFVRRLLSWKSIRSVNRVGVICRAAADAPPTFGSRCQGREKESWARMDSWVSGLLELGKASTFHPFAGYQPYSAHELGTDCGPYINSINILELISVLLASAGEHGTLWCKYSFLWQCCACCWSSISFHEHQPWNDRGESSRGKESGCDDENEKSFTIGAIYPPEKITTVG